MALGTVDVQSLKDIHRKTWASGDYARIAELVTDIGERVVTSAGVHAGSDVLDVAAGTGNAAIPAARTGAQVTATDLTPELFAAGRRRASEAGVEVEWLTADAEDLPFDDGRFDYVLSSIGVQFAPRHEVVARELVRVCRNGGTIALGNWAADGYIGRFWQIMGPYLPPPPEYASSPAGWGRPEHVERLFAGYPVEVSSQRHALEFEADSAEAFVDTLAEYYGPLLQARSKLTAAGRWDALRDELVALSDEVNTAGRVHFRAPSEYLLTVIHKRI